MLELITPPEADPVSVAEIKAHLRIEHDDEDALLATYVRSATAMLDGPAGMLGRCLMAQTWRLTVEGSPRVIPLPLPPCLVVERVLHGVPGETEHVVEPDHYAVTGLRSLDGARVRLRPGIDWPDLEDGTSLAVEFTAGYGSAAAVPEDLRQAIRLLAGHLYENREQVVLGGGTLQGLPLGALDSVRNHRVAVF